MTQSTTELVQAFKANGGKVVVIPMGTSGEIKYRSILKQSWAHSQRARLIWQVRMDATAHGREKSGCGRYAAVDVFMKFRNEKGI